MPVIPLRPSSEAVPMDAEGLPADLHEELDAALEVADRIDRHGLGLRLVPAPPGGRLRVELLERDGTVRRSMSGAEALDLAAGRVAV